MRRTLSELHHSDVLIQYILTFSIYLEKNYCVVKMLRLEISLLYK